MLPDVPEFSADDVVAVLATALVGIEPNENDDPGADVTVIANNRRYRITRATYDPRESLLVLHTEADADGKPFFHYRSSVTGRTVDKVWSDNLRPYDMMRRRRE